MAKLNKEKQKQTENAASGFDPVPDGVYHLRLRNVDPTKEGPAGPYWVWEFEILEPEFLNRRQWTNTSLAESAAFKLKEAFAAFNVGVDTDTDDLCGQVCLGVISQGVIQSGNRKGEIGNQIDRLKPIPENDDFEIPEAAPAPAENIF